VAAVSAAEICSHGSVSRHRLVTYIVSPLRCITSAATFEVDEAATEVTND
jgi:hypothetical protein